MRFLLHFFFLAHINKTKKQALILHMYDKRIHSGLLEKAVLINCISNRPMETGKLKLIFWWASSISTIIAQCAFAPPLCFVYYYVSEQCALCLLSIMEFRCRSKRWWCKFGLSFNCVDELQRFCHGTLPVFERNEYLNNKPNIWFIHLFFILKSLIQCGGQCAQYNVFYCYWNCVR